VSNCPFFFFLQVLSPVHTHSLLVGGDIGKLNEGIGLNIVNVLATAVVNPAFAIARELTSGKFSLYEIDITSIL
jgi:hypothetical protein